MPPARDSLVRLMRCLSIVLAALGAACGAEDTADDTVVEVETAIDDLIAADNRSDVDAIASAYALDAVLMPPSGPPVEGRDTIRARYEEGFRRFRLEVSLDAYETRAFGSWAFSRGVTHGRFVWRDGSPPTPFRDKYLMILRSPAPGRWEIATLMWNPEAPG